MKKYLYSLILLLVISINAYADGLTATLQQGDTFKYYSGKDAFTYAYAAAEDGAIITLSPGTFTDVASIKKQISIIGSSAFETDQSKNTILGSIVVACNKVKIEGIRFNGSVYFSSKDCFAYDAILKRCWVDGTLACNNYHYNTVIDQCVVRVDRAIVKGHNYCLKNSIVYSFKEMNSPDYLAYITNCIIREFSHFSSYNPYQEDDDYKKPYAIYRNNLLGVYKSEDSQRVIDLNSPSEFYNNMFYAGDNQTNMSSVSYIVSGRDVVLENNTKGHQKFNSYGLNGLYGINLVLPVDPPLGSDSTAIGPCGGSGFSLYPAIPRITSKKIDSYTNSEGKIRVQISVVAEQ